MLTARMLVWAPPAFFAVVTGLLGMATAPVAALGFAMTAFPAACSLRRTIARMGSPVRHAAMELPVTPRRAARRDGPVAHHVPARDLSRVTLRRRDLGRGRWHFRRCVCRGVASCAMAASGTNVDRIRAAANLLTIDFLMTCSLVLMDRRVNSPWRSRRARLDPHPVPKRAAPCCDGPLWIVPCRSVH